MTFKKYQNLDPKPFFQVIDVKRLLNPFIGCHQNCKKYHLYQENNVHNFNEKKIGHI